MRGKAEAEKLSSSHDSNGPRVAGIYDGTNESDGLQTSVASAGSRLEEKRGGGGGGGLGRGGRGQGARCCDKKNIVIDLC